MIPHCPPRLRAGNEYERRIKLIMDMIHNSSVKSSCGSTYITARLVLTTEIAEFDRLRSWFQEFARQLELPEEITSRMLIAADEVFTNIAEYAYPGTAGQVEVSAEQQGAMLRLTFEDTGKPFDPTKSADPDIQAPAAERPIGGLGIFVMKRLMDQVEYRRENGCNILTLSKRINPEAPQ
ncbi:MAG: ATP-binding protein [Lentisphaerae bacterium]|nr:ATP-binding protein [Lentisphaerota bacterium]